MKVDHIGYAVRDVEKAKASMASLGYIFGPTVEDRDRNVSLCFGELSGYRVELVAPLGPGSPVDLQLSKIGPSPYHICYLSSDLEGDIEILQRKRFKVSLPPAPAVAFGGKRVAFLYSLAAGLIEIVEQ